MAIGNQAIAVPKRVATTFDTLSLSLDFPNEDQALWWKDTAPLLERLLSATGYDVHLQYLHLIFHYRYVLAALGPYPKAKSDSIVPGGCPYELSVNFQQGKTVVRFDFAPTTAIGQTGRSHDQYCPWPTVNKLLAELSNDGREIDTRLYNHFINALAVTKKDLSALQKCPTMHLSTQSILSWDLKSCFNDLKMYFFPLVKADAVRAPSGQLVLNAVRGADGGRFISPAFNLVETSLGEMGLLSNVCILGWDCVPDEGRVKIYLAEPNVTKANVHHLWTVGGRLNSSTINKGWELLSRLWDYLGIPEGVRSTTELGQPEQEDGRSGLTFSYELRPGSLEPEPKIYIPLVGENDMAVVRSLAQFTSDLGWTDLDSYPSKLANVLYVYSLLNSELTRY
jgi:DMATS type aromatic prenyltransferase